MKIQEVIDLIDNTAVYSLAEIEWENYLPNCKCVAQGLNLEQHRWYNVATNVYECEDGFVGVRGLYQSFNEILSWKEMNVICTAEEYIAVPSVTYKPKNS